MQRGHMSTSTTPECKGMMAPVLLKWAHCRRFASLENKTEICRLVE